MQPNRSIPDSVIIPVLLYRDVREASQWLCRAFGFNERLFIGDHRVQLTCDGGAVVAAHGDAAPSGHSIMVRVADADAHCARARREGARILSEPQSFPYGERQYSAQDPGGHVWTFTQSVADVDPAAWGGVLA
ncbi:MAG TPA: VOC family protein [Thermoanaerobaculia bacterium]|nr:VOC family protein [Thermoanaerobaculia bacterium]